MKTTARTCLGLVLIAAGFSTLVFTQTVAAQENNEPPPGFKALFNGKDLSGWHGLTSFDPRKTMTYPEFRDISAKSAAQFAPHWRVENGDLVNDGFGTYATSDASYGDIELWIDYKTVPKADSGIYLRQSPQVQIWDYTEEAKFPLGANLGSGGLWNNSKGAAGKDPLVKADKPFGEWNRFRIIQAGARTSVWLNGQLVVDRANMENIWDRSLPLVASGPIQLQTHGGEIRWKNIFLRELSSDEANKYLRGAEPEGFVSVFNGKDFEGWGGPVENYDVKEGSIVCKPGKGGTIFTKDEFGDFVARVEFRLPAGGNNGLAIRYPGTGDPAYAGMCELQVLDTENKKYAKLDPRQAHGSAYGMVPAHRGYLRPVGEWNYQEVTVKGSTIKVELNGTIILDTDLSKVSEYMANSPHPGKERTAGHFGFAGHNDPVEFRNIAVKKL